MQRVSGVRGITDNIVISSDPIPGDVAAQISEALARKRSSTTPSSECQRRQHHLFGRDYRLVRGDADGPKIRPGRRLG